MIQDWRRSRAMYARRSLSLDLVALPRTLARERASSLARARSSLRSLSRLARLLAYPTSSSYFARESVMVSPSCEFPPSACASVREEGPSFCCSPLGFRGIGFRSLFWLRLSSTAGDPLEFLWSKGRVFRYVLKGRLVLPNMQGLFGAVSCYRLSGLWTCCELCSVSGFGNRHKSALRSLLLRTGAVSFDTLFVGAFCRLHSAGGFFRPFLSCKACGIGADCRLGGEKGAGNGRSSGGEWGGLGALLRFCHIGKKLPSVFGGLARGG